MQTTKSYLQSIEVLNTKLKKHGVLLPNGQIFVTEPILGFKKVDTYAREYDRSPVKWLNNFKACGYVMNKYPAIVNLIIPAGALLNLASTTNLKLRASNAVVHSIYRISDKKIVKYAKSKHSSSYNYRSTGITYNTDVPSLIRITKEYDRKYWPEWMVENEVFPSNEVDMKYGKVTSGAFDTGTNECSAGIHFFVDLDLAKRY